MPTFEEIKAECLKENKLFKDPDFPAEKSILHVDAKETVKWRRPHEIDANPVFFNEATYYDINQTGLGDCFFLSAVNSLMANARELLNKVMPRDQSFQKDYAGIFRFNFWQFGDWKEVYVDDRLPMIVAGDRYRLIHSLNDDEREEMWVALLEKAYAKHYGSYKHIDGGYQVEALVDLTGGVGEKILFNNLKLNTEELFNILQKAWKMGSLLIAGINGKKPAIRSNGLIEVHSYAVTALAKIKTLNGKTKRLIRLRNPQGDKEWNGAWSDS